MRAAVEGVSVGLKTRLQRIALVGNPNTGKTTLFNCLTGLRQKVGNYPGVTVQKKAGFTYVDSGRIEVVDLPGTYSLAPTSPDERVVSDALLGEIENLERPDLALCIVDATNLKRNLFLVHQIGRLGIPMVVALNRWDTAQRRRIKIDIKALEEQLGVPVVAVSASRAEGIPELKAAASRALEEKPMLSLPEWPKAVQEALASARETLRSMGSPEVAEAALARAVFDADTKPFIRAGLSHGQGLTVLESAKKSLFKGGLNPANAEAVILHRQIKESVNSCIDIADAVPASGSESIDSILTHRFWGLIAFVALMYLVFQSVYSWAGPFMDLIDAGKGALQGFVSGALERWPIVQSLATDGIIEGVGAVVIFLPQILILFFFISLLEDTGYMARAAFLMDKLFSWCGLSGKSFVPLLSSFACAIPGVMAARTIQDPKARLVTILAAPFMSCSARLPVYVLMIGAFVEPRFGAAIAGAALFAMHFVGAAVALPFAYLMNRYVLRTPAQPFLLELPTYQVPQFRHVLLRMYSQGKEFVKNAGTVIFAITIVIWGLLYFPRPAEVGEEAEAQFHERVMEANGWTRSQAVEETRLSDELSARLDRAVSSAYIEQSYMGRIGKTVQPIFAPAGFDWKITVGVIASFPAREVIISTLGIIYSLGGDVDEESSDLRDRMKSQTWPAGERAGEPIYTIPVVVAIMVFFALCQQCGATLAVIAQETSWRWAVASFAFMTGLAWLAAVIAYQVGTALG